MKKLFKVEIETSNGNSYEIEHQSRAKDYKQLYNEIKGNGHIVIGDTVINTAMIVSIKSDMKDISEEEKPESHLNDGDQGVELI